jgi:aryl-alcohol dehydrogenase-like predicted oxidoreductase
MLGTRRLGRTQMVVTELSLGGVAIGGLYGPLPEADAAGAVRRALELGINYVDTSPLYLESEARLGQIFGAMGGLPAGVFLSTKTGTHPRRRGDYSAAGTRWSVENSLRLLGVPAVDLLLLHDPRSPADLEQALGPGGAVEELERMKGEGKVRAIGLGCRAHAYHRRAIRSGKIDVILTYADYNLVRQTAAPLMAEAAAAGVGVILAQAVLAGLLTGVDPASDARLSQRPAPEVAAAQDWRAWATRRGVSLQAVAIQYGLRNPHTGCVLVGAKTAAEVEENVAAATTPLDDSLWEEVEARIRDGAGQAGPSPES